MNSRQRLMLALNKEIPDRLPVTVHQWQQYHLNTYMGGITDLEAFRYTGMDAQIQYFQDSALFWLVDSDNSKTSIPEWRDEGTVVSNAPDDRVTHHTVYTPEGTLTYTTRGDRRTTWITDYLIKHDEDIDLIRKYMPVPGIDLAPIARRYDEIGDEGILRGFIWGDQGGCWQHAACLMDITQLIYAAIDKPDWVHALLDILLEKKLRFIDSMKGAKFDLVETGGGSASSTVISPTLHREFCLPYDRKIHDALHALGFKVTYHTCGGTRGIEEYIVANGCDASETGAPPSIGGNQEPWELKRKLGKRLAIIGGIDQINTITTGPTDYIKLKVREAFEKVGYEGGYICAASDHFFDAPIEHLKAFAEAARECTY